ncbi:MAG: hypothetical protein JNL11_19450 [Bdellovibrionaceae bacterium]|nr:hypothetical protein [Pseudobdellovibrionaceae bacterium]
MKKLILTAIIVSANLAQAAQQEQVGCLLPNMGAVKSLVIESGTTKPNPDPTKSGVVIDNPGTLTLFGSSGVIEKANPTAGTSGIFNEYNFPNYFLSTNDAMKSHVLKFETKQLGPIYIAYICHRPNSLFCEDRSGNLTTKARVAVNLNGKTILNFNDKSLPLCGRRIF